MYYLHMFLYTGVDVLKDDGYYSAVLLSFQKNGFNSVKVRATAKGGNDTRLVMRGGSRAFVPFLVNGSKSLISIPGVPHVSLIGSLLLIEYISDFTNRVETF